MTVPNVVKDFMWRASKNALPIKANLIKRKVLVDDPFCLICGVAVETTGHILWSHYKKNCFSPLAGRHVYGHCTRGELLAACKSPRKYTRPTRLRLTAQLAACILIRAANWPRVLKYTRQTVGRVYYYTRGNMFF